MGRRVIVLVGEGTGPQWDARLAALGWGRVFLDKAPTPYPGEPWALDNGAYRHHLAREPFDPARFLRRLSQAEAVDTRPLFAVVPDVVAGGDLSLSFSLGWMPALEDRACRAWPWYLAVQDGMMPASVAPHLAPFAGVFLGGSSRFKGEAPRWLALAREHGKRFHYARAGTLGKLEHALELGADSADSAFPMWTHGRWRTFVEHATTRPQGRLFDRAAS